MLALLILGLILVVSFLMKMKRLRLSQRGLRSTCTANFFDPLGGVGG